MKQSDFDSVQQMNPWTQKRKLHGELRSWQGGRMAWWFEGLPPNVRRE